MNVSLQEYFRLKILLETLTAPSNQIQGRGVPLWLSGKEPSAQEDEGSIPGLSELKDPPLL